jgi:hypothetical protein
MKVKRGVKLEGLKIQMRYVLIEAEALWLEFGQECVITSATEYVPPYENLREENKLIHSPGSLHYYGYAVDLRTHYFDEVDKVRIAAKLQKRLNKVSSQYKVILEQTHIHIQWNGFNTCLSKP